MDMKLFVQSLTDSEVNTLSDELYHRRLERAKGIAQPLTKAEMDLASRGFRVEAIKSYRNRLSVSLFEAKAAVDAAVEKTKAILNSEEWSMIALGRKIDAIRSYRNRACVPLVSAKDVVEKAIEEANEGFHGAAPSTTD